MRFGGRYTQKSSNAKNRNSFRDYSQESLNPNHEYNAICEISSNIGQFNVHPRALCVRLHKVQLLTFSSSLLQIAKMLSNELTLKGIVVSLAYKWRLIILEIFGKYSTYSVFFFASDRFNHLLHNFACSKNPKIMHHSKG